MNMLQGYQPNATHFFSGSDSLKQFNKVKRLQPFDWIYHELQIVYETNSHGYRTIDFNNIDWNNSIIVFGCSTVFGIGLAEEHTLCKQLQTLTNTPVINLGCPGSSIEYNVFNSSFIREKYRPQAIVQLWTGIDRYFYYEEDGTLVHKMPMEEDYDFTKSYKEKSLYLRNIDKMLWEDTKYIEMTWFKDAAEIFGIERLEHLDAARDCLHPGIESNLRAAERIYDVLS